MKKTKIFISLIILLILLYIAYAYKNKYDENKVVTCLNGVVNELNLSHIEIDVRGRLDSPVISGKVYKDQKKQFLKLIKGKCDVVSFEDFITIHSKFEEEIAQVNFTLDSVNNIATIIGLVNSSIEQQEILNSFTAAVNKHYGPWTIKHEIITSKNVSQKDFSIDITLIFTAISLVKVTDISFIENKLIVKGLVRNESTLEQTTKQINQLFSDELQIINQLENVVIEETDDIEVLEIDLGPIELLELNPKK